MTILTLNLGSSSLKYAVHALVDGALTRKFTRELATSSRPAEAAQTARAAIADAIASTGMPDAVGHRLVFGGEHDAPARVTTQLRERLEDVQSLDPLHVPGALAIIREAEAALRGVPQIACFDTAFFHDLPRTATVLPLPGDDPLFRRYGFHGLSYEHVCRSLDGKLKPRTIVAHLGNGASAAALRDGRPIDTTMGLTPLGGMIMSTRPGDVDPGALLYLLNRSALSGRELRALLEDASGLRALSGGESDMRALCERHDEAASFAVEMFVLSAAKAMGGLAVELGGLDMLVFTGGIGAHNAVVRERIAARLAFINSAIAVEVVEADENASIAHNVVQVLSPQEAGSAYGTYKHDGS